LEQFALKQRMAIGVVAAVADPEVAIGFGSKVWEANTERQIH
jgi:hypothetical protein